MADTEKRYDDDGHEICAPTSTYHEMDELMTKGNVDSYRENIWRIDPNEAKKRITLWDRVVHLFG